MNLYFEYLKVAVSVFADMFSGLVNGVLNSLRKVISLTYLIFFYVCIFVGEYVYSLRGEYEIGGEMFLPVLLFLIVTFIKMFANKIGKGIDVPVPRKRFTQVFDSGEVTVEKDRVEEMVVYLSDLEDWLEYKHLM